MHHIVEIHAPAMEVKPTMVYDSKNYLINTMQATRAGITCSDHNTVYTVWFEDSARRSYMARVFNSQEEATLFLESIYNIKE